MQRDYGAWGSIIISGTDTVAGPFCAFQVLTNATFDTGTVGNCSGLSGVAVPAANGLVVRGHWAALELSAGSIIAYYAKDKA